jgi:hypothetical protein
MNDLPHYLVPSRHGNFALGGKLFRAAYGRLEKRSESGVLRFLPEFCAHTAANGPCGACGFVRIPSLDLRFEFLWRGGPLRKPRLFTLSAAKNGAKGPQTSSVTQNLAT